jgi:hypothetical protein
MSVTMKGKEYQCEGRSEKAAKEKFAENFLK